MFYNVINNVDIIQKFDTYKRLLEEYNKKFNLTAIKPEDYDEKHFNDSLYGLEYFVKGSLLDVGTGAGFPGMVLAICNKNLQVTLLEATKKKCEFLEIVKNYLSLKNVTIVNARAEEFIKNNRERFDYVTARAVAELNTLSEYCIPFVKIGGYFIAYKGGKDELKNSLNAIKILGGIYERTEQYLINNEQRSLIFIKKIKSTNIKYPRGNGKERKCPL